MKGTRHWAIGISICLFILFPITHHLFPTYAEDSSPSADIQSKIDLLKSEIASRAAAIKTQVNKALQNRVLTGLVQSQTSSQIVLSGEDRNRTILINKFTDSPGSIKQDDFLIALGDIDDKGNLVAKKLIKQKAPDNIPVSYIYGKIKDSSPSAVLIYTKEKKEVSINTTPAVIPDTLIQGMKLIIVAIPDKAGQLKARFIYPLPTSVKPKPASTSASQSGVKK